MKKLLLILLCLLLLFTTNTAKAQPCQAGETEINFVTIGTNSTILPNLKISDEAYIGAGAVVTKDVRKNEIVAGNPARFVKYNSHKYDLNIFKQLLKIKKNN